MDREVIDSLRTFHDLTKAINSSLDMEEVVAMVLEKTSRLMRSSKVLLMLLDRQRGTLQVHDAYGFKEGELQGRSFRRIRSFEHCIVRKGTVITLDEVLSHDDYCEILKDMPFLSDMVFAPLEVRGEAYGLIGVIDRRQGFTEEDLEIFCALGSQSAVAIENAGLYERLKYTFVHTAEALAEAVNRRDPYTGGHARRVAQYSLLLGEKIGLPSSEKETLRLSAILHDIGKIGIEDSILRKGGLLTEDEALKMRKHPEIGAKILGFVEEMGGVIPGVLYHHEWFDGSGYPEGLRGEDIPLRARIIAIADTYDAMTTTRPYRKALDVQSSLEELAAYSGTHFDPSLVEEFRGLLFEEIDAEGLERPFP